MSNTEKRLNSRMAQHTVGNGNILYFLDLFYRRVNTYIKQGRGIEIGDDGSKYEGWFHANKGNGKGRILYTSGDKYEGNWKDDMPNGYGIFTWLTGSIYRG